MKRRVENLVCAWIGDDYVAEADFMGKRLHVRCRFDTYQRCWSSDVYLMEESGLRAIDVAPWRLYSSSKLGAVYRGLRMAKYSIQGIQPAVSIPVKDRRFRIESDGQACIQEGFQPLSMHWGRRLARASKLLWRRRGKQMDVALR